MHPYQQTAVELARESAEEIFAALGPATKGGADSQSFERAAVIGFVGEGIRGTLGIGMNDQVRDELTPFGYDPTAWQQELANQFVGRMKRKLMSHGLMVDVTLPMVLRGVRLELVDRRDPIAVFTIDHPGGAIATWLDVELERTTVLEITADPEFQSAPEGELILF